MREAFVFKMIEEMNGKIEKLKNQRTQVDQEVVTLRLQVNVFVRIMKWMFPFNLIFKRLMNKEFNCYKEQLEKRKDELKKIRETMAKEKTPIINNPKTHIGRNAKCHCGSGKKFKNCCIDKKDDIAIPKTHKEVEVAMKRTTVDQLDKKDDIKIPSEAEIKEIEKNSKIVE